MAYPGDGYKMSNYGCKKYSPEQMKAQWHEQVERERKLHQHHAVTKRIVPVDTSKRIDFFDNNKQHPEVSQYNQTFHFQEGYNQKLKRDDMEHTQGLGVLSEEESRQFPILSSSDYGRRQSLDVLDKKYVRVGTVKKEFYRSRGINV